jgi:phosphoribosyl-dephospho-CoA transferase
MKTITGLYVKASARVTDWSAHDLLWIRGVADLICIDRCPFWVEGFLQKAPFVVVCRAEPIDGVIPVGVRGSSRNQRFAAYVAAESVLERITPEQLTESHGWRDNTRSRDIPALHTLAAIEEKLANFQLAYGPTGSIGFELASGFPAATSTSDLDLLIRAPEHLSMQLAQELITIFSETPCRVDVQLETPRGAVSLAEYAQGETPLLLRQCRGPVLIYDPWEPPTQ